MWEGEILEIYFFNRFDTFEAVRIIYCVTTEMSDVFIMTLHRLLRDHGNRRDSSYASYELTIEGGEEHNRIMCSY